MSSGDYQTNWTGQVEQINRRRPDDWRFWPTEVKLRMLEKLTAIGAAPLQNARSDVPDFPLWLPIVSPTFNWNWPHIRYIQSKLERVTLGECHRMMLFVPPRHGKSELVTIRYPVWRMERNPTLRTIITAYNSDLATEFSWKARQIALERFALAKDRKAAKDWKTWLGGGMRAAGVGNGITGRGGDLIIIDDPIKGAEEANSLAFRNRAWNWYRSDLMTRLEPGGSIIIILTRWHHDDLIGRILTAQTPDDAEPWMICRLPALAEADDPLGRLPGQALCPERYNERALHEMRMFDPRGFEALYQQNPTPPEGDFFKRPWFRHESAIPRLPGTVRVRFWDAAASTRKGADLTAGVLLAGAPYNGGYLYWIEDAVWGQWATAERNNIIKATADRDNARYPQGVQTWREQEPGSSGLDVARQFVSMLAGYAAFAEPATGSKEARAEPFASQASAGNVWLITGPWTGAYLDLLLQFPMGSHDDLVDATSGAFRRVTFLLNRNRQNQGGGGTPTADEHRYVGYGSSAGGGLRGDL